MRNQRKYGLWVAVFAMMLLVVACGKKKQDVDLTTVVEAIKTAYGDDYLPDAEVDSEMLSSIYGLEEDMYEEIYAEIPMISANIDTLIAVKCIDGKQKAVADALRSYREYLVNDSMQYPTNKIKVQASRVIEKDGYVFFVALGSISPESEELGDEAILKQANENNDIAEKVIDSYFSQIILAVLID